MGLLLRRGHSGEERLWGVARDVTVERGSLAFPWSWQVGAGRGGALGGAIQWEDNMSHKGEPWEWINFTTSHIKIINEKREIS